MARVAIWKKRSLASRIFQNIHGGRIALCLILSSICSAAVSQWLLVHGHRPPVGVYIAIMGAVAALMIFHDQPNRWEKASWLILIIIFMVAEIRNIYTTDKEQSATFSKISQDLDTTKTGLDTAQRGIESATEELKDTATGINTLYAETTGGNSYFYLDISIIGGPLGIDSGSLKKGMMFGNTIPKFVGNHPLHNVYLSEFGPLGPSNQIDYGTIFPKEIGRPRAYPEIYFYPDKPKQLFFFFITTSNGSYSEVVLVKRFGDKWLWACRFSKSGRKKPILTWSAPGFPKEQLNSDWGKLE